MRTRDWIVETWVVIAVYFFLCVCSRFQTFDGTAHEQHKMHLDFKHCIHSAKPFLSDKPKLFLVFYVVSMSKCKLGFTITVFGLLSGHVNARKNFTFAQAERQKLITSVEKKNKLWTISLKRMYITRTLLVVVKEKAIIQSRKQVQSIGLLHIFLAVSRFPTQRLPIHSLLRNLGNDKHVATLVSGKRYVLAGIVDWGLEGDKLVNRS